MNPRVARWLRGLAGSVIGGVANSVVAMIVAPSTFNFNDLPKLGQLALGSSIVSAALYLKQSPLPPEPTGDTETITNP